MRRSLTLSLAAFLVALSPAWAGLDFTLQHKSMAADGLALSQPYITDGSSKIFLRIPLDWKVADSGSSLDCTSASPAGEVRLESFAGNKPPTIDPAGGAAFQAQVISQLPADAKEVAALPLALNALPIFGWSTVETTFKYTYFGQTLRRSVMYVGMIPGRAVQLTVIAPDADFDKVHKQARQLLSSWFEPSRDLPPDLQRKYEASTPGGS